MLRKHGGRHIKNCIQIQGPWWEGPVDFTWNDPGVIMGAGDVTAQVAIEKRKYKQLDIIRTAQFAGLGICFVGPTLRSWYTLLEKVVNGRGAPVKKMALDQGVFAPIFLGCFLGILGVMQNQSIDDIKAKIKQDYFDIMKTNWLIWPPFQLFNFYIIPFQHRVMAANLLAFFWNTYLAWKANRAVINPSTPDPLTSIDL